VSERQIQREIEKERGIVISWAEENLDIWGYCSRRDSCGMCEREKEKKRERERVSVEQKRTNIWR